MTKPLSLSNIRDGFQTHPQTILVAGATGYIASRLIPRLLTASQGYRVRCLARNPVRLIGREWYPKIDVTQGDVTDPNTLQEAMQGVHVAYYLIHNMSAGKGYQRLDLEAARNFAEAAKNAGVGHIIYLGGLADPADPTLSKHMRSRIETGDALRQAGVPVTEFRAGVVAGPGSVSFEMIRFIAEQFPLLIGPDWLRHRSQPIAASNLLDFLMAALVTPEARGKIIEIGSPKVYTYQGLILEYARIRGFKRRSLLLPFIPVGLMAFIIDLLTPVEHNYAIPLVGGLKNDSLVRNQSGLSLFPGIQLLDYVSAVKQAIKETHPDVMERIWLDHDLDDSGVMHEGMLVAYRRIRLKEPYETVLEKLVRIVQAKPHLKMGFFRTYEIDFQDVTTLRLKITHIFPSLAWLEWKVSPYAGGTRLEQTIFFAPCGAAEFLTWHLTRPFHARMFNTILRELVELE